LFVVPSDIEQTITGTAVLGGVSALGLALMRRGRKLMATSGEALLAEDHRAPVIYLRPFAADTLGTSVVTRFLGFRYFTEEEQLAMVMNEIGPFVAIGDPREVEPDLGAARIYVRGENWQLRVSDLVSRARLVILRAGTSEGFWYELRAVRESVPPESVLLLIPADRTEYATFRDRAREVLPYPLPEIKASFRPLLGRVGAVVEFDREWRPRILPVRRSFLRRSWTAPYVASLKLTVRPVFDRLGLAWFAPKVVKSGLILLIIAGAALAIVASIVLPLRLSHWTHKLSIWTHRYITPRDRPSLSSSPPAQIRSADPESSALDKAMERLAARSNEIAEFREAMRNATSPQAAREIGQTLSQRGLRRLSDDQLLQRVKLMNRILTQANITTCAAIIRGNPSGMMQTLRRLEADEIEQWFDLIFESMVAELRQYPKPDTLPRPQVERAYQVLIERLPSADSELLIAVLSAPLQATDVEVCAAGRLLHENLLDLPEPHRAVLARSLVTPS